MTYSQKKFTKDSNRLCLNQYSPKLVPRVFSSFVGDIGMSLQRREKPWERGKYIPRLCKCCGYFSSFCILVRIN